MVARRHSIHQDGISASVSHEVVLEEAVGLEKVHTVDSRFTGVHMLQTSDGLNDGRLARAVLSDQTDCLSGEGSQGQVVHEVVTSVLNIDTVKAQIMLLLAQLFRLLPMAFGDKFLFILVELNTSSPFSQICSTLVGNLAWVVLFKQRLRHIVVILLPEEDGLAPISFALSIVAFALSAASPPPEARSAEVGRAPQFVRVVEDFER